MTPHELSLVNSRGFPTLRKLHLYCMASGFGVFDHPWWFRISCILARILHCAAASVTELSMGAPEFCFAMARLGGGEQKNQNDWRNKGAQWCTNLYQSLRARIRYMHSNSSSSSFFQQNKSQSVARRCICKAIAEELTQHLPGVVGAWLQWRWKRQRSIYTLKTHASIEVTSKTLQNHDPCNTDN